MAPLSKRPKCTIGGRIAGGEEIDGRDCGCESTPELVLSTCLHKGMTASRSGIGLSERWLRITNAILPTRAFEAERRVHMHWGASAAASLCQSA